MRKDEYSLYVTYIRVVDVYHVSFNTEPVCWGGGRRGTLDVAYNYAINVIFNLYKFKPATFWK